MRIPTLTPDEAVRILRDLGMKISPENLRLGIQQGVYPFGVYIETKNQHPVYQIFRKLFDAWIEERAEDDEPEDWPPRRIG